MSDNLLSFVVWVASWQDSCSHPTKTIIIANIIVYPIAMGKKGSYKELVAPEFS